MHFIGLENFTPRMLSKENSFLGGKINGRPEACCLGCIKLSGELTVGRRKINEIG